MDIKSKILFIVTIVLVFASCAKEPENLPFKTDALSYELIGIWYRTDTVDNQIYEEKLMFQKGAKGNMNTTIDGAEYFDLPVGWWAMDDSLWISLSGKFTLFNYTISNDSLTLKLSSVSTIYKRIEE